MNLTQEQLQDIVKVYTAKYKRDGYVGMDFNMAVLTILAKRGVDTGHPWTPHQLEYWSGKRAFCHLRFDTEDHIILHAHEDVMRIRQERNDFQCEELITLGLEPGRSLPRPRQHPTKEIPNVKLTQQFFDIAWHKFHPTYEDDVHEIVKQAAVLGIEMDVRQAWAIWRYYSASMCATWITYEPERVEKALQIYITDKLNLQLDQAVLDSPL